MRIILGADHGGFLDKEKVKEYLVKKGFEIIDVGAMVENAEDDYVDFAKEAVEKYSEGDKIILFCRNGFGMCITANRYKGIRCGIGFDKEAVARGRRDDDINCLSIPSDYVSVEELVDAVETFIGTDFSLDPKYLRRINKIDS